MPTYLQLTGDQMYKLETRTSWEGVARDDQRNSVVVRPTNRARGAMSPMGSAFEIIAPYDELHGYANTFYDALRIAAYASAESIDERNGRPADVLFLDQHNNVKHIPALLDFLLLATAKEVAREMQGLYDGIGANAHFDAIRQALSRHSF